MKRLDDLTLQDLAESDYHDGDLRGMAEEILESREQLVRYEALTKASNKLVESWKVYIVGTSTSILPMHDQMMLFREALEAVKHG